MEALETKATTLGKTLTPHEAKRLLRTILDAVEKDWQEATAGAGDDSAWKQYLPLLKACKSVLEHAPLHPNEAKQINPQRRLDHALERLATTLKETLFGGAFSELEGYVMDDLTKERRRQQGLSRYKRAKQRQRRGK